MKYCQLLTSIFFILFLLLLHLLVIVLTIIDNPSSQKFTQLTTILCWSQFTNYQFQLCTVQKYIFTIFFFFFYHVFGLLSSSLLSFSQHFGRYVLRPSSGVCQTWQHSRNFKLRPLLNPQESPVLILLAITEYKC